MEIPLQLSSTEKQMMKEVFQIFSKYEMNTRKFGVNLIHSHFRISEDEILYEAHDTEKRILLIKPRAIQHFKETSVATGWHQSSNGEIAVTMLCCDEDGIDNDNNDWQ